MAATLHPIIPRVERQHALIEELRMRAPRSRTAALAIRLGISAQCDQYRYVLRMDADAGFQIQIVIAVPEP